MDSRPDERVVVVKERTMLLFPVVGCFCVTASATVSGKLNLVLGLVDWRVVDCYQRPGLLSSSVRGTSGTDFHKQLYRLRPTHFQSL